ncbi:MAG TPA: hypothetical protein VFV10_20915 [Gammaproteobacteria bacterium]|nr:hypothetical protein [Gammaproteobacteria bacterium]
MNAKTTHGFDCVAAETAGGAAARRDEEHSAFERVLALFTTVRPGEGRSALLFSTYALVLLVCYYVLKTVREPLLLAGGSAALKSYACGAIAGVLLVGLPLYAAAFKRTAPHLLIRRITVFFMSNLGLFYLLGRGGIDVGFAYYVWVGVFGVTILAQLWAHAAHTFSVEAGQRLFPLIMTGAALGALVGPRLTAALFPLLGPWNLILVAVVLLAATLPLVERSARSVPPQSSKPEQTAAAAGDRSMNPFGGFTLVLGDRYLLLLALLAVVLNCVNTTGEYILTDLVLREADRQAALDPGLDKANLIASFYGDYYMAVNALGMLLQLFLVARLFRRIGVPGASLILPIVALVGYGLVVFLPVFGIIRAVKVLENSTNYSIMNTARHALFLPLPARHQYEGKTAVDTFFWRLGDLVQAGWIYAGLHWFGFGFREFAAVNMVLALFWIVLTVQIAKRYPARRAAPRPVRINRRRTAIGVAAAVLAVGALSAPVEASAEVAAAPLFAADEPLAVDLVMSSKALCRRTERSSCADAPAALVVRDGRGAERRIDVRLRVRGIWRNESGNCTVPPLFVFFPDGAPRTPFEGQKMLPLTTHCRNDGTYEQYVLKEYLAYRIYNLITDDSLRVRLVRITYRDTARRGREVVRYAFFTEHFDSLAKRRGSMLQAEGEFSPSAADARELAAFELFQYLIGNTDWSAVAGHNVASFVAADGRLTAVPYDFDFSGLVDASYAAPARGLPINSVTQRLYRGFCHPGLDWFGLFERFSSRRNAISELIDEIPALDDRTREKAHAYLDEFFRAIESPKAEEIVRACRRVPDARVAQR